MIPTASQEQDSEHRTPEHTPNELGQNPPDLRPDMRRPEGQEGGEHENQGTVAQRPSEAAPQRTSDGDQLGEGARHSICSGESVGEFWYPGNILASTNILPVPERIQGDTALGAAPIPDDVMKGSANGFDPLKAILGAVSTIHADHKVCK